jgi:hypothetical protein
MLPPKRFRGGEKMISFILLSLTPLLQSGSVNSCKIAKNSK